MRLVLVRHAEAQAMHASDAERALTPRGHEQARKTAQWLRQALSQDLQQGAVQMLASPYVRARQTAAAIAEALQLSPDFVEDLTPDVDPRRALRAIEECAQADTVVVVTHMPLVAALAAWLESGVLSAGRGFMLAEARILEADVLAASAASVPGQYFPDAPGE